MPLGQSGSGFGEAPGVEVALRTERIGELPVRVYIRMASLHADHVGIFGRTLDVVCNLSIGGSQEMREGKWSVCSRVEYAMEEPGLSTSPSGRTAESQWQDIV